METSKLNAIKKEGNVLLYFTANWCYGLFYF